MDLLAAQLYAESGFNPFARSPAGAQGIAQFMPGTARAYGLREPFDAERGDRRPGAPDERPAEAVRRQAALALAAYNAGPGAVERYGGVPPYRGDARLRGEDPRAAGRGGPDPGRPRFEVRLVE